MSRPWQPPDKAGQQRQAKIETRQKKRREGKMARRKERREKAATKKERQAGAHQNERSNKT